MRHTRLKLSWKVNRCKPLTLGPRWSRFLLLFVAAVGRGLHSTTSLLDLSASFHNNTPYTSPNTP